MNVTLHDCESTIVNATSMKTSGRDKLSIQCVQKLYLAQDPDQAYFLYLPNADLSEAPVMVCVHGISRNAEEQINSFMADAKASGIIVIAPLFDAERFPDYQRLGRRKHGQRADLMLQTILQEVGERINITIKKFSLFGYSGGAQFAHRYLMAYPEQINAAILAAAGWYTFPDAQCRYPRGIAHTNKFTGSDFNPEQFLRVPVCVLVGEHDIIRDSTLRSGARLEHQQGLTRRARAVNWIKSMRQAAKQFDYDTSFYFELLPETGHSFATAMETGEMGKRTFRFLFPSSTV